MRARNGLLALLILPSVAGWAAPADEAYRGVDTNLLAQVRTGFETAPESAAMTQNLIARLDAELPGDAAEWPPVLRAYRAALEGLLGKHSRAPWTKYRQAQAGLARFAGLPEAHPESIEIRMLRYSFCSQLPDFFEQGPQAEADLAVLADLLDRGVDPMVDARYRRDAIRWILRHGAPPADVRRRLEAALAAAAAAPEKIALPPPGGGE